MTNIDQTLPAVAEKSITDRLTGSPMIDRLLATQGGQQQIKLIKATVAQNATDAELAHFLELCAHYGLDPFAKEAWCAKGKTRDGRPGRLLIMVGRDGLRKIVARQGFIVDGDVVHEQDTFTVSRGHEGREVHHSYGKPADRGEIVGAWAEVRDASGQSRGFFYAPLHEFRPSDASAHSPWAKQTSVMILAAAERQACRQATPLGGLLVEGEDESANAVQTGMPEDEWKRILEQLESWVPRDLRGEVVDVMERAREVGHAGLSAYATYEMGLKGRPPEEMRDWLARADEELAGMPEPEPEVQDADVEPDPQVEGYGLVSEEQREQALERARVLDRQAESVEDEDPEEAGLLRAEAAALRASVDQVRMDV